MLNVQSSKLGFLINSPKSSGYGSTPQSSIWFQHDIFKTFSRLWSWSYCGRLMPVFKAFFFQLDNGKKIKIKNCWFIFKWLSSPLHLSFWQLMESVSVFEEYVLLFHQFISSPCPSAYISAWYGNHLWLSSWVKWKKHTHSTVRPRALCYILNNTEGLFAFLYVYLKHVSVWRKYVSGSRLEIRMTSSQLHFDRLHSVSFQ